MAERRTRGGDLSTGAAAHRHAAGPVSLWLPGVWLMAVWLVSAGALGGCDDKSHNINPATTGGADAAGGGGTTDGQGTKDALASSADGSYTVVDGVIVAQDAHAGADAPPPPEPGVFGAPCLAGGDCESGYCFQGPDGRLCTETCAGDCPDGYRCRPVDAVGSDLCVPLPTSGCRPCAGDFQCGGGACLSIDGEDRCAPACETSDDCLHGGVCGADPMGEREGTFCLPATGSCSCDASVAGGVRMCAVTNDVGTCPGLETCDPVAGWGGCDAPTAAEEICNGLDDDCDGLVDDGLPETQPCEQAGDTAGLGTCQGEARCAGAAGWVCDAPTPAAEVCDGADNDCDGQTDEDFRDADGFWTLPGHCGSCGHDCAAAFPHGQGTCGGTPDAPVCVVASCDPGYWKINEGGCVAVPDLACQPCLTDADCLGGTCADLQGERACVMPCAETGAACANGYTCQPAPLNPNGGAGGEGPAQGPNRCVPDAGSCSCTEEAAAQGFTRPCGLDSEFGKCMGEQACTWPGGWGACSAPMPAAETCNGLDDDCDGLTDEGLAPPTTPCLNTNAVGSCLGSWTCEDTGDGQGVHWACDAPPPQVETCNGLDDDCDGQTDEGFGADLGGLHAPCFVGQGACQNVGEVVCSADTTGAVCSAEPLPGGIERCNGLDDDCDGQTDEDFLTGPQPLGTPCVAGQGMCTAYGVWTCEAFGPEVPPDAGTVCSAPAGEPLPELCNGMDDDCDGQTDEDFQDAQGFWTLDSHCGGCGVDCTDAIPHGTGQCGGTPQSPTCEVFACDLGFVKAGMAACVQPVDTSCAPCQTNDDCGAGLCAQLDDGPRCVMPCGGAWPSCGQGYACEDHGGGLALACYPTTNTCSCTQANQNQGRACFQTNEHGSCAGNQTCTAEGWSTCDAKLPAPEVCNGQDDNCDGTADEGFPQLNQPCTLGVGECQASGVFVCSTDGQATLCDATPGTASAERCDGLDNDCNGIVDDPYLGDLGQPCKAGLGVCETPGQRVCAPDGAGTICDATPPSPMDPEYCNGLDDDCNGQTDEDFPSLGQPCSVGQGVCERFGTTVCSGQGYGTECDAVAGTGAPEACNGLDDDCDGQTDNVPVSAAPLCPLQEGVCAGARAGCKGAAGWGPCDEALYKAWSQDAYEPKEALCDTRDNDCDGLVDNVDLDGDQHFAQACAPTIEPSLASMADDCDDTAPSVHPGAEEQCNGVDDDCDGITDEVDRDHDGYVDAGCLTYTDTALPGGDCDDQNPFLHPGAPELCGDGLDNDCSGAPDDADADGDGFIAAACGGADCDDSVDTGSNVHPGAYEACNGYDDDCDGVVDNKDDDDDGYVDEGCSTYSGDPKLGGDCNDGNKEQNPGHPETCGDGVDNNCDGWRDNKDLDKDLHVDATCIFNNDPSMVANDCDDANPEAFTGHSETCGDGVDNDCDTQVDDKDADGDGHYDAICASTIETGLETLADDCDDQNPFIHPGAPEVCGDIVDNDCSGYADDKDQDGDFHVDMACAATNQNPSRPADDCRDDLYDAHPGMGEGCNGVDDDCNGIVDDVDLDHDGYVDQSCGTYAGDPALGGDCNDDPLAGGAQVHPGAPETCVGAGANRDDDCDGWMDNKDDDGDGHVDTACQASAIPWPADDCDDANFDRHPGLPEACGDGLDNDCSGYVDDKDLDGDGHGDVSCVGTNTDPSLVLDDCDDQNPEVNAGLAEVCGDGVDNDCSGYADDKDDDNDGHFDVACRWSLDSLLNPADADDCDDNASNGAQSHPGLVELCGDGLDNDCDGTADNLDADGDGFVAAACGGQDCDDDLALGGSINPAAWEICNGVDDNCDGQTDDLDLDGDGHMDALCVGYTGPNPVDDCADLDPAIFPGAQEKCGDGVDQDCTGHDDDKDWDLDGHIDGSPLCQTDPGGAMPQDDCNDEAMESYPGGDESTQPDLLDNDCNGLVDDGTVFAGDVVITEMMIDPAAVPDTQGEWIEVYNNTSNTLNLDTWTLTDGATESFTIAAKHGVLVPAGGYAVLCTLGEWDYNGGVFCDVEYAGFDLSNVADTVTLQLGTTVIDTVSYDTAQGWTVPSGASLQLDPTGLDATANDGASAWCASSGPATLNDGEWASPGADNASCGAQGQPAYVSAVYPFNGVLAGGESITIDGMNFLGATGATVDGQPCTAFSVVDDMTIQCTTPAGSGAGPVDVKVLHPNGDGTLLGGYTYTEIAADTTVDWCNLQSPFATATTVGQATETIYGRVHFSDGTVPPASPPVSLIAEVGFGGEKTNPGITPGWVWATAVHNPGCTTDCGANYEYEAKMWPDVTGTFSYAYRFSMDGGITWSYCDTGGTGLPGTDPVDPNNLGSLTVNP